MFNLATIYLNIARMESVEAGNDNERLRNTIKSYQFATGYSIELKTKMVNTFLRRKLLMI